MEGVLTAQLQPPGRPGWWGTGWSLALGFVLGWCGLVAATLALALVAGVAPDLNGTDAAPFVPADAYAVAADLGFWAFALAVLAVPTRWVLVGRLERDVALTWVVVALGLGGVVAYSRARPEASFTALLLATAVVRYGALDADGVARDGLLARFSGQWAGVARVVIGALPLLGLLLACAYGVTHPLDGGRGGGGVASDGRAIRTRDRPVRAISPNLEPRGLGKVTVLDVRVAGAAAAQTRVVAAGAPVDSPTGRPQPLPRAADSSIEVWLAAHRCPATPLLVDRLDVRVQSWSGRHWTPVRLSAPWRVRCVR